MENREAARYAARGVSSSKSEVHKAIAKMDKGLFPSAFCKIVPDFEGADSDYCLAMHADGAGTKSSLSYAYWRETGDMSDCDEYRRPFVRGHNRRDDAILHHRP